MMRDLGNRIVRESDPRVVRRRRARASQTGCAPTRQTCALWPRVAWACCVTCRQTYRAAPRGGSSQSSHDVWYCAAQRERAARQS